MIYREDIPYLKTVMKKIMLDLGKPSGYGNLVFFFTNSQKDRVQLLTQKENCYSNKMYYYFYPARYYGNISYRKYRLNNRKVRDELYQKMKESTDLHPYPPKFEINEGEKHNTYYDLSTYWKLFQQYTSNYTARVIIRLFWEMFNPIFKASYGNLTSKYMIFNADQFQMNMHGDLKTRLSNPFYLMYMTLFKEFDLIKDLDMDFLIFSGNKILKFNPSKCDEKSHIRFLAELKKLYRFVKIVEVTADDLTGYTTPDDQQLIGTAPVAEPEKKIVEPSEETKETHIDRKPILKEKAKDLVASRAINNLMGKSPAIKSFNIEKDGIQISAAKKNSLTQLKENLSELDEPDQEALADATKKIESAEKTAKEAADEAIEEEDDVYTSDADELANELAEEEVTDDEEVIARIYDTMTKNTTPKSQRSTARDQLLREKQKEIMVKGMTIDQLSKINPKERKIQSTDISKTIKTTNPNMKEVKFNNFNESYVKDVMPKDIVGVFEELNDKSIKMFIRDIKVDDTSDVLNYKETWTVSLEDENRTRHTIKVDVPKIYDKNFLWLGGNKKDIKNQMFYLPVVKINNDTVMIVTNYNKMSIKRMNPKTLREVMLMEKLIESNDTVQKYFTPGSSSVENRDFVTGLEYDEFAKRFLRFSNKKVNIYFSQKEATELATKKSVAIPKGKFFIGFNDTNPIFVDNDTQKIDIDYSISEYIVKYGFSDEEAETIRSYGTKIPKRLMYTKVTTMKQDVPMCILMCLWEGLAQVLKKANVKYRITNDLKTLEYHEDFIKFSDCYLIYENSIPTELLMNGLKFLNTKDYKISEMELQSSYVPYITKKYGKVSILNALNNVYEFTIGNIEKEILRDMNLPLDLVSIMVYANSLLADNQYVSELDMSEYRIRCAEIIPAILYDTIAKAYVPFKNSNGKKKLSIPQDAVIKKLLALQTVEDYSSLNPFLELETTHGVSTKGWRGVNLEDSYTVPKRSYDKSMTGIIGVSSSPDGQVGVNRCLTMEPTINSVRGYVDIKSDNLDDLKDVNLFSPAEMLIPLGATRDDPIRTGHSVKQSRASVPVKGMSPVLMSNGSDEISKYYLSSDFVVNADQDGTVIDYDPVAKIMIVEYKDGSHRAINLDKNIVKNGGGGFELSNVLVTDLKVGDKFKANETLAWHKNFFKKIPGQGVRMCVGALIKVAIYSSYNTYEDADFISERLSHICETEMCFRVKCVLGKNSNVFRMVNVGDEVLVGDSLIDFDESFEESDINQLLASLEGKDEIREVVEAGSRNMKKSGYSGVIEDIKIFTGSEVEELSPSLQKIVSDYYKRIDRKTKLLNKYDKSESIVKCGLMVTESTGKTEPNRYGNIRGEKVNDGVLIEFYVKHAEPLEVGSKVANFSPLKNVVGEVIPKGYEPTSEYRPEECIDTTISPSSILSRMVSSILPTAFGNKVIIELKRHLQEIWLGSGELSDKKKKMLSMIYRVFGALDKTGANTKKYKDIFTPMSDAQFKSFFNEFFSNEDHYLILDMVDYDRTPQIEDIEDAAKILNVPLFEYVTFPHFTMDKDKPIVTKHKVPVGYIHIKRPQQTVMKKNGISTSIDDRSAITQQVMGSDKNGRESDLENCMLVSLGMEKTLKELNGARADDMVAKQEMLQSIATKGYVALEDLTDDISNKATLNTINTYFLGMGLHTDLVSKTLKLPYEIDEE